MSPTTFRIGQCNILNQGDFPTRYQMLAEAAQEASLDLLLAQEVVDTETFTQKLSEAGYPHIAYSAAFQNKNVIFYLAMASKTPLASPSLPMTHASASYIMVKQTVLAGQNLNLFTAHLAHGFHNELERVRALELVEAIAKELEAKDSTSVSILGGDLNALPESRSLRYMKGLELNLAQTSSTHWVDAWEACGDASTWTTNDHSVNPLGMLTAKRVGVQLPEYIPARRIDYLLTRGWAYGKTGCPINFQYLKHPSGVTYTDHEPFYVDFLLLK